MSTSTGGRSAARTPLAWFQDMIGMYSFRAFAGSKPSWMLSYSWEKEKQIAPGEAMKNLAMAQLMAGTNTWDVAGACHVGLERHPDPQGDLRMDQGTREDVLSSDGSRFGPSEFISPRRPGITLPKSSSSPTAAS